MQMDTSGSRPSDTGGPNFIFLRHFLTTFFRHFPKKCLHSPKFHIYLPKFLRPFFSHRPFSCFIWYFWFQDKMVAEKMVWTKWYGQNGIRTKWYWTKRYGQNGTDKMVRIKNGDDKIINQSINPAPTDNMIFSSIPLRH